MDRDKVRANLVVIRRNINTGYLAQAIDLLVDTIEEELIPQSSTQRIAGTPPGGVMSRKDRRAFEDEYLIRPRVDPNQAIRIDSKFTILPNGTVTLKGEETVLCLELATWLAEIITDDRLWDFIGEYGLTEHDQIAKVVLGIYPRPRGRSIPDERLLGREDGMEITFGKSILDIGCWVQIGCRQGRFHIKELHRVAEEYIEFRKRRAI